MPYFRVPINVVIESPNAGLAKAAVRQYVDVIDAVGADRDLIAPESMDVGEPIDVTDEP